MSVAVASILNNRKLPVRNGLVARLDRALDNRLQDRSADPQDAYLYSGRAVELDGVGDYVNIGNRGTLAKAVARIQYQARRGTANSQPRFRLNSGLDLAGASLVRPGVWEEGEIVTPAQEYGEYMWFDGVNDLLSNTGVLLNMAAPWTLTFSYINGGGFAFGGSGNVAFIYGDSNNLDMVVGGFTPGVNRVSWTSLGLTLGVTYTMVLTYNGVNTAELFIGGASRGTRAMTSPNNISAAFNIGTGVTVEKQRGVVLAMSLNGVSIWGGTLEEAVSKGWTVSGSPQTVNQVFANASEVWLGRASTNYFNGALANVRFLAADGEVLARYQLNEHPAGLVNTLPALDSSGNGYHGSYVGGTSVAGIGVGANFRGLSEYGDYMWFDGVNDDVVYNVSFNTGSGWELEFFVIVGGGSYAIGFNPADNINCIQIERTVVRLWVGGGINVATVSIPSLSSGGYLRLIWNPNIFSVYHNGVFIGAVTVPSPTFYNVNRIRFGGIFTLFGWSGAFADIKFNGTLIATGRGTTSAAWGGGTVVGNPATIAEYRRTPPQVGMGDWNVRDTRVPAIFNFPTIISGFGAARMSITTVAGISRATVTDATGTRYIRRTTAEIVSGKTYRITSQILRSANVQIAFLIQGTNTLGSFTGAVGVLTPYTINATAGGSGELWLQYSANVGEYFEITAFSLEEVLPAYVVPATPTDLDALGNPIAVPRLSPTAFHSPNTSLFLRADQTQVRALSFWFYHSGLSRTLFSNVNLTIGLAANGTVTTTSGTIHQPLVTTLGWNLVHINLPSATNLTDFRSSDSLVDGLLVYDRVLSEPEILRNYNHVRRTYQ